MVIKPIRINNSTTNCTKAFEKQYLFEYNINILKIVDRGEIKNECKNNFN